MVERVITYLKGTVMKVIAFSGNFSSVNKSNNAAKADIVSYQKAQTSLPASKLIMPDSETLKVYFTSKTSRADSKARKLKAAFEREQEENPNAVFQNDFVKGSVTLDDIKPGAKLPKVNLMYFNFVENNVTDISGINFKEALLNESTLNGVKISDKQHKADLIGAVINGAKLRDTELSYAKLDEAHMHVADLTGANLTGAKLSAQMNGTKFNKAVLNGATLNFAWLMGAKFNNAELANADLKGAEIKSAEFKNAWLLGADFKEAAAVESADFNGAYYNAKTKFPEGFNPEKRDMIFVPQGEEKEFYNKFKNIGN
jgi:uncharacterized protein YjbI with pentapeptide repeats